MAPRLSWFRTVTSRKLLISDGARYARLYDTRSVCAGIGLNITVVRGEITGLSSTSAAPSLMASTVVPTVL